jgi:hypothetical protein
MKFVSAAIAGAALLAAFSTPALAQQQMQNGDPMQVEQQACEGDVYALCGEAIPDQKRIETCLRAKWSKVSHKCRSVMASYGKRHNGSHDRSD